MRQLNVLMFVLVCNSPVAAGGEEDWERMRPIVPRRQICYRALVAPEIDGKLDDPAWKNAPFSDDFVDIEGDRKPKPRFRTRMKLLWDETYLYVGAELEEPHVWATIKQRDAVIFHDNDFEIFLDPDGDGHQYFELETNALNTAWDLRLDKPYKDGGKAHDEWNIDGLKSAVHVRGTLNDPRDKDEGWTVELAIPWQGLKQYAGTRSPPCDGDQWRFNCSRVEWKVEIRNGAYYKPPKQAEDNWVWSPQGVVDMHRPERWGWIQFSSATQPPVSAKREYSEPVRETLHHVYYLQRDFRAANGRFAGALSQLNWRAPDVSAEVSGLRLQTTPAGYRAFAEVKRPGGGGETWQIDQDCRIRPAPRAK